MKSRYILACILAHELASYVLIQVDEVMLFSLADQKHTLLSFISRRRHYGSLVHHFVSSEVYDDLMPEDHPLIAAVEAVTERVLLLPEDFDAAAFDNEFQKHRLRHQSPAIHCHSLGPIRFRCQMDDDWVESENLESILNPLIDALPKPLRPHQEQILADQKELHFAIISHRSGSTTGFAGWSKEELQARIADYCRENWEEDGPAHLSRPEPEDDPEAIISDYFEDSRESLDMESVMMPSPASTDPTLISNSEIRDHPDNSVKGR